MGRTSQAFCLFGEPLAVEHVDELPAPRKCDRPTADAMLAALHFEGAFVTCPCCDGTCVHEVYVDTTRASDWEPHEREERWCCTMCDSTGRIDWERWLDAFAYAGGEMDQRHDGPSNDCKVAEARARHA